MSEGAGHILIPAPPRKPSALKRLEAMAVPSDADFILLGDSLAAAWPADLVATARPGRGRLNLGLPGDRIQNTLWRIGRPGLHHLRPREVLLVLGTNNLSDGDEPGAIAAGLAAVVAHLDALWSRPALILATIPPRGGGNTAHETERLELNRRIERMQSDRLRLLRTGRALAAAGDAAFEADGLHISRRGYECLATALAELSGEP